MNELVGIYKKVLADGQFQLTYQYLVGVIQNIRTFFSKKYKEEYSISSILHGYIDVTYFYIQNDFLKNKKLKFAVVLNHQNANFELWLVAQTKDIQISYWQRMKDEKWVDNKKMPQYSIFETTLLDNPDFNNKNNLIESVQKKFESISNEILVVLEGYI